MSASTQLQRKAFDECEVGSSNAIRIGRIQELIAEMCTKGRRRILDVGCGGGIIMRPSVRE